MTKTFDALARRMQCAAIMNAESSGAGRSGEARTSTELCVALFQENPFEEYSLECSDSDSGMARLRVSSRAARHTPRLHHYARLRR